MNMKQIETSLQQLFNEPLHPEENRKVVFWHDYDEELVNVLQVCVDAGAKRILIPAASVADLQTVPADLLVKFQPIFYAAPIDAVF